MKDSGNSLFKAWNYSSMWQLETIHITLSLPRSTVKFSVPSVLNFASFFCNESLMWNQTVFLWWCFSSFHHPSGWKCFDPEKRNPPLVTLVVVEGLRDWNEKLIWFCFYNWVVAIFSLTTLINEDCYNSYFLQVQSTQLKINHLKKSI